LSLESVMTVKCGLLTWNHGSGPAHARLDKPAQKKHNTASARGMVAQFYQGWIARRPGTHGRESGATRQAFP
jgi:hypothetical protein